MEILGVIDFLFQIILRERIINLNYILKVQKQNIGKQIDEGFIFNFKKLSFVEEIYKKY